MELIQLKLFARCKHSEDAVTQVSQNIGNIYTSGAIIRSVESEVCEFLEFKSLENNFKWNLQKLARMHVM